MTNFRNFIDFSKKLTLNIEIIDKIFCMFSTISRFYSMIIHMNKFCYTRYIQGRNITTKSVSVTLLINHDFLQTLFIVSKIERKKILTLPKITL